MKTEQAIQVLRDFNLWRRREDENVEQPDPYTIGEAIDDVLMAVEKSEAERDLWREEAKRWREQTMELDGQLDGEIQRLQWRQYQLDCGINELKGNY